MTFLPLRDNRTWLVVPEGDDRARALYGRHYSYRPRGRDTVPNRFGPGEKIVLVTPRGDALFLWRWERYRRDNQQGVNCAVFRNEGPRLSSGLILAAEKMALARWPGSRLFTFINKSMIRSKNPGYCFKVAGWKRCGETKTDLIIMEKTHMEPECS